MRGRLVAGPWCGALAALVTFVVCVTASAAEDRPGELARKGFFGTQIRPATAEEREKQKLKDEASVAVDRILPESTASEADIRGGDILLSINGKSITTPPQFVEAIVAAKAGENLTIELARDGEKITKKVALKARPRETSEAYQVVYDSVVSRGNRLRTIVTRPKDDKKHPALFLIQGLGGFSIENAPAGPGIYSRYIDEFARRGFVTMRVDKPGQGDSEGGPTRDVDFETELDGYRQGLKALKALDFVDADNIVIFGHSMGGVMGPLLGAEIPVKGIAAYGTVARTWHEYLLENTRRQEALAGTGFAEIDRKLHKDAAIDQHILDGLSPAEIAKKHPVLKARVDESFTDGKYYAGRHYVFFRQLAGKNLPEAWEKFGGHGLAVWGKSDFVTSGEDHDLIARILNGLHAGRGVYLALDGIDHGFNRASSPAESFKALGKPGGEFNPAFLDALRDWATKLCGVGSPSSASRGQAEPGRS